MESEDNLYNDDMSISRISPNNNFKYLLISKNKEIENLKKEKENNKNLINSLKFDIANLTRATKNTFQLEVKLKESEDKCSNLKKEIISLKNKIIEINKKYKEEKRKMENNYTNQIIKYKKNESEQLLTENKHQIEKEELLNEISLLKNEKVQMNKKMDIISSNQKIVNQIKISNLKQHLIDNINETKKMAKELNIEYTDEANKLTLLQNHQLLIQLEYQSQQLEEISTKNKILSEKVNNLLKDLEIHKKVELNLAEKNKKLTEEINRCNLKSVLENMPTNKISTNELSLENNLDYLNSTNLNNSNINSNINSYSYSNSITDRCHLKKFNPIKYKKSIRDLENKLRIKQNEYIDLKEKNDSIENILKNYEQKYNGLFYYFEECLNLFFNDEDLKNNQNIFINMDSMKKGDFSSLSKEEKYTALIIMMKYLLPLINSPKLKNEIKDNNRNKNEINKISLKFHSMKKNKINNINKIAICKNLLFGKNRKFYEKNNSTNNIMSSLQSSFSNYLPSINKL